MNRMRDSVDSTTRLLAFIILLLTFVIIVVVSQFIRRRRDLYTMRVMPAYDAVPRIVGEAVERNRPVHVALGGVEPGTANTLQALAGAELAYHVMRRGVVGAQSPIITVSQTGALPLAQDTLRRAYASRGMLDRYRLGNLRWYPGGARSLAFAAALTAVLADDNVGANVVSGAFGPELALIGEAAARRRQNLIATSTDPEGQAVAFVYSGAPLIGEELFVAGAYFEGSASQLSSVVALDVLRWLVILAMLLIAADGLTRGVFSGTLARLLAGG